MAIVLGTQIGSPFNNDYANNCTLSNFTLATGEMGLLILQVRQQSGVTLPMASAPVWNGQSFTLVDWIEDKTGDAQSKLLVYRVVASAGATANITWSFDQYTVLVATAIPVSGMDTTTPIGTVYKQNKWDSAGWTAPSLNVTDSISGDLIFSIVGTIGWDDGYSNLSAVVWTPGAGQTTKYNQYNTAGGANGFPRSIASSKAGASGTVNVSWTKDTGSPSYQHIAFAIKAPGAPLPVIDSISTPLRHGDTGKTITTSNLGTLTTMTVGGVNVTALSASGGDGTFAMPARTDGGVVSGYGSSVAVGVGDGSGSATGSVTVSPPTTEDYIELTSNNTSAGYIGSFLTVGIGWQIGFSLPGTLGVTNNRIEADGRIATDYEDVQTIWVWNPSTKVINSHTFSFLGTPPEPPTGGVKKRSIYTAGIGVGL